MMRLILTELNQFVKSIVLASIDSPLQAHTRWLLTMVTSKVNRMVDLRKSGNDLSLSHISFDKLDWQGEIRRHTSNSEERERLVETLDKIYLVRCSFDLYPEIAPY